MKPDQARYQFLHDLGICCVTGQVGEIHVAHIRGPDSFFAKPLAGTGQKSHWIWTLPLNHEAHSEQHKLGERRFWDRHGYPWADIARGPLAAALILEGFRQSDNIDGARAWLTHRAQGRFT